MKAHVLGLAVVLATSTANSLAGDFEGPFVDVNINLASTTVKFRESGDTFDALGRSYTGATLGAGYGLALGPTQILTFGATLDVIQPTFFEVNSGGALRFEQDHRYGLYAAPGMIIGGKILAYGKLSYSQAKGKASGIIVGDQTFNGFGIGFGAKYAIAPNIHLNFEFQRVMYGEQTTAIASYKPVQTIGSVGVGFSF
jgi:opacity protein-like surface antigen